VKGELQSSLPLGEAHGEEGLGSSSIFDDAEHTLYAKRRSSKSFASVKAPASSEVGH
jgi:hypothetical protein